MSRSNVLLVSLGLALAVLLGVGAYIVVMLQAGDVAGGGGGDTAVEPPRKSTGAVRRNGTVVVKERIRAKYPGIERTWNEALALHRQGRHAEALEKLRAARAEAGPWFEQEGRDAVVNAIEEAALQDARGLLRRETAEAAMELIDSLRGLVRDPARRELLAQMRAEAERVKDLTVEKVLAAAQGGGDKAQFDRHLQRFGKSDLTGGPPKLRAANWVDRQLDAVWKTRKRARSKPVQPLSIADEAAAEQRRIEQLEKLRKRQSVGLLDHIHAGLAWLALHQGDTGRFSDADTIARCKKLGHKPACLKKRVGRYDLATSSLAVLAFLDFRDQDKTGLFEPTLSRGVDWLLKQQQANGSLESAPSNYSAGIGLMALGQAASSSGRDDLRLAVEKAFRHYAGVRGHGGGYRYKPNTAGDLSVSGWFVQAMEAAHDADAVLPPEMVDGLDGFVASTWKGEHRFAYTANGGERASMSSVGMLSMSILDDLVLDDLVDDALAEKWREHLARKKRGKGTNDLYQLYYDVRVQLMLDGVLTKNRRGVVFDLAKLQSKKGHKAGMIEVPKARWMKRGGPTLVSAFSLLILEHTLYRR